MGQGEVDGFNAGLVLFAFAGITKAANAVVGLDVEFGFQRSHKGAKHVEQHPFAALGNHSQHLHIDQGGENNWSFAIDNACVVDLSNGLVGFVNGVDKGQTHMTRFGLKLRKNCVAKGLSGDARAV
jgi:hypothetical protein